ncbi:hypothetical protein RRG08_013076 [Elysia crispata]|uniref:Uncharacterized protein n=1 Tax=Elysia crispata TaxID=231223 RepID=A0AAE1A018_9GAST|nr:hypothetical protein RRG08_013076 [Elysia crispata]
MSPCSPVSTRMVGLRLCMGSVRVVPREEMAEIRRTCRQKAKVENQSVLSGCHNKNRIFYECLRHLEDPPDGRLMIREQHKKERGKIIGFMSSPGDVRSPSALFRDFRDKNSNHLELVKSWDDSRSSM